MTKRDYKFTIMAPNTNTLMLGTINSIKSMSYTLKENKADEVSITVTIDFSAFEFDSKTLMHIDLMTVKKLLRNCNIKIILPSDIGYGLFAILTVFKDTATIVKPFMSINTIMLHRQHFYTASSEGEKAVVREYEKAWEGFKERVIDTAIEVLDISREDFLKLITSLSSSRYSVADIIKRYNDYVTRVGGKSVGAETLYIDDSDIHVVASSMEHAYVYWMNPIIRAALDRFERRQNENKPNKDKLDIYYNTRGGDISFLQTELVAVKELAKAYKSINIYVGDVSSLGSYIIMAIERMGIENINIYMMEYGYILIHDVEQSITRGQRSDRVMHHDATKYLRDIINTGWKDLFSDVLTPERQAMLEAGEDIVFSSKDMSKALKVSEL